MTTHALPSCEDGSPGVKAVAAVGVLGAHEVGDGGVREPGPRPPRGSAVRPRARAGEEEDHAGGPGKPPVHVDAQAKTAQRADERRSEGEEENEVADSVREIEGEGLALDHKEGREVVDR